MVIVFLLFFISGPINNYIASEIVEELKVNPLPEKTTIVEEKYVAARLSGNGDGVQYFGALLLKSELSLDDLNKYYSQFSNDEESNIVDHQYEKDIKQNELSSLQDVCFNTNIEGDDYYILYTWGDYDGIFAHLDMRGIN